MAVGISGYEREGISMVIINNGKLIVNGYVVAEDCKLPKHPDDIGVHESIIDKMFHEQIDFKNEPKTETWRDREQLFW